ncbi:hypothetical protein Ahy_A06g030952 isoform B [Arachis hypogaea]|uniref:Uncharacterized protein n=1 Tax=Arachis hypogaea TaxID=3818 RepID=A0A445CXW7_ARAHY|nr:hypothetical protein Ahy_A06g030952 isoform B [Arachis hypogaea]
MSPFNPLRSILFFFASSIISFIITAMCNSGDLSSDSEDPNRKGDPDDEADRDRLMATAIPRAAISRLRGIPGDGRSHGPNSGPAKNYTRRIVVIAFSAVIAIADGHFFPRIPVARELPITATQLPTTATDLPTVAVEAAWVWWLHRCGAAWLWGLRGAAGSCEGGCRD